MCVGGFFKFGEIVLTRQSVYEACRRLESGFWFTRGGYISSTSCTAGRSLSIHSLLFSSNIQHALRKFEWSIQTSSRLLHVCNSQNPLSEVLQASYTLFGSQNRLSEHQAPLMLFVNEKWLSKASQVQGLTTFLKTVRQCHTLRESKQIHKTSTNLLHTFTHFVVVKTDSLNIYKLPSVFALVKWLSELLQASTCFAQVVTDFAIFCKPPTRFTKVKTDSPNFLKRPTRFADVKTDSPNICNLPSLHVFEESDSPFFYKPPTRFAEVKSNSSIFYKPPTRIAEVKMHYQEYYMPPTRFVEDETDSWNIYKLP